MFISPFPVPARSCTLQVILKRVVGIFLWIEQVNMNTGPQKMIRKKCRLGGKYFEFGQGSFFFFSIYLKSLSRMLNSKTKNIPDTGQDLNSTLSAFQRRDITLKRQVLCL